MRIEEDLKLGFKDVLSALNAPLLKAVPMLNWNVNYLQTFRSELVRRADYCRKYGTVGTFSMASALASFDILTAVINTILSKSGKRLSTILPLMSETCDGFYRHV